MRRVLAMALAVLAAAAPSVARAEPITRGTGESDRAFAARALGLDEETVHTTLTDWNGATTLFVDFERDGDTDHPERPIVALRQEAGGAFRKLDVTVGETEGGAPEVTAIAFANADRDAARELIVLLAWRQPHFGGCGPVHETRIFDDAKPGLNALRRLPVSDRFGAGCAGRPGGYRYATIAAVKAGLRRLGF